MTGVPLPEQRIAILGAGSAGCGIAGLLIAAMVEAGVDAKTAARRFFLVDRTGCCSTGMNALTAFQKPFAAGPRRGRGVADRAARHG